MELVIDQHCFLIGRACRVCRILFNRVVVRPLLYRTWNQILHTAQARQISKQAQEQ